MSAAITTEWELKLRDYASGAFKKLQEYATGSQKKINDVSDSLRKTANVGVGANGDLKRSYGQLEDTLKGLEDRQKKSFNTKHIQGYQALINKTKNEMEKLNSVINKPSDVSKWTSLKNNISSAASEIPLLDNAMRMLTNPAVLIGGAALFAGVVSKKSVDLAVDYERGMAKINATAQLTEPALGALKTQLIDIGSYSGGNFELIPGAYEKILSQTNNVNLSLDILKTSVKGAKAGFTDIDTVSGALAKTLSVVGEKNTTAAIVMDTLFKAKALGAGEFSDFATYLPQLIAAGKNLSINFKDTAGMFAFMTAKGQSATDSAMLMQNAFTALQKKEVIIGLDKKGLSLFNKDGSRRNIDDFFMQLSGVMDKMTDFQKTKFLIDIGLNDAQARNAFSVLTSDSTKFKNIMTGVNDSLGETNRQLAATSNHSRTWGDLADKTKSWGVAIGDKLLPEIDKLFAQLELKLTLFGLVSDKIFGEAKRASSLDVKKVESSETSPYAPKKVFKFYSDQKTNSPAAYTPENGMSFYDRQKKLIEDNIAAAALKNLHQGKGVLGDASNDGSKVSDLGTNNNGGSKIANLTMNLSMHNVFEGGKDADLTKIGRRIADAIVDAARDGMVTIGV